MTNPALTSWQHPGAAGQVIYGNTHLPDGDPVGVVLICHGFKGYKDYGFLPQLAQACAARGLIAHRFNFSHSGMTDRIDTFEQPDLFEQDTWQKQIDDLTAVASAVEEGQLPGLGLPLIVFGHSRGGITALLTGARWPQRFAGIVTAAAPHRSCELSETQQDELLRQGRLASPSSRTGQTLYVGRDWLLEQQANPDACDPVRAAAHLAVPLMFIHGESDQTIAPLAANALHTAAPRSRFILLAGSQATHTFGAPNPLLLDEKPPAITQQLMELVAGFAVTCAQR